MVTINEIEKLATLSRIEFSKEEIEEMTKDIGSILGYVDQINNASFESTSEKGVSAIHNVMRSDELPHESGINTEALLSSAPKREGEYVKVKKIL